MKIYVFELIEGTYIGVNGIAVLADNEDQAWELAQIQTLDVERELWECVEVIDDGTPKIILLDVPTG